MLDNLSIICYVFGRNFINTLIEVSLPSFLNSHSSSSKKFNLTFTFITNQDSEEYLKKCLSQLSFDYKFKIRLAENEIIYNSKRNGRDHIDIWLRELHLCSADYIFFLIPDNLYTTSFCDKIYNEIENVDFLINYPFYVAKEPLLNTMGCTLKTDIRDLAVNQSYIINLFRKFAHPLIWTWLKGNPVGLANFHNEIYISEEANQINFYNLAEHPIIFNLKKNKGYNLDFQLRSQDNYTAKFIYAESASLDTLSNQFWQIYASSYHYEIADYYRLNDLLGCCENFSDSQKIIRSFCILDNKAIEISNDCSFQKIRLAIETARTEIFLEKKYNLKFTNALNYEHLYQFMLGYINNFEIFESDVDDSFKQELISNRRLCLDDNRKIRKKSRLKKNIKVILSRISSIGYSGTLFRFYKKIPSKLRRPDYFQKNIQTKSIIKRLKAHISRQILKLYLFLFDHKLIKYMKLRRFSDSAATRNIKPFDNCVAYYRSKIKKSDYDFKLGYLTKDFILNFDSLSVDSYFDDNFYNYHQQIKLKTPQLPSALLIRAKKYTEDFFN